MLVRAVTEKVCEGIDQHDYTSEVAAIYYWVCATISYRRDPWDVELVKSPALVLKSRAADCDEIATLLAAMCMTMGNPCRFCVVSFEKGVPSHVFCQTYVGGKWVTVDPVAGPNTHEMQNKRIVECRFFPCR